MRAAQTASAGGSGKDLRVYDKQSRESSQRAQFLWDKVPRSDVGKFLAWNEEL